MLFLLTCKTSKQTCMILCKLPLHNNKKLLSVWFLTGNKCGVTVQNISLRSSVLFAVTLLLNVRGRAAMSSLTVFEV